jgi:myo-inositol-1(or 4)-monophosphatase
MTTKHDSPLNHPPAIMSRIEFFRRLFRSVGQYQRDQQDRIDATGSDHKGRIDLVTDVDRESERRLVEALDDRFPDDAILAEEQTARDGTSGRRWIIDPLDGTTNYVHGHPFYGISVGLQDGNDLTAGYAYFPESDEFFHAETGNGAYKNGESISVSSLDEPINSLLATGFADMRTEDERFNMDAFKHMIERVQGIRRAGSAVHDLCMVADGVFEGFWEFNLQPWDVAAGAVIIREAGGTVTDLNGGDGWLNGRNIVASNDISHDWLLDQLRDVLPPRIQREFIHD